MRLLAAALGAMAFVVWTPAIGVAQQTSQAAGATKPDQNATAKTVKPAPRTTTAKNSQKTNPQAQQWTIENALPDHSAAMRQYEPPPTPQIGRVPLRTGPGTIGFESDRRTNPYQTPDGATIRGQEALADRSSSYAGVSWSVPTSDKALNIPVPWNRP